MDDQWLFWWYIETALDTTPMPGRTRPCDTEDPPLRDWTGTEQRKKFPRNWAAPANTIAGNPPTRATKDEKADNRGVFNHSTFTVNGQQYTRNYCRYYYEDRYNDPGYIRLVDPKYQELQCDEYPFASTKQGANNEFYDYSLRALGRQHNGLQGSALNSFYTKYRVVNPGDPFWVMIDP
ncbi:NucA/NucB deoxyribonuclease domain-containing protein [Nonomuraea sp. NPDC005650]|uniref:NucA/NucB deoxyribonuclease domain-containing protein n=1 Tax=Nonomuraea sp. NPDC005650 TaxID=3157045 RepID=UPI0033B467A7